MTKAQVSKEAQVQPKAQVSSEALDRMEQFYTDGIKAGVICKKCKDLTFWTKNGECMTCVNNWPNKNPEPYKDSGS